MTKEPAAAPVAEAAAAPAAAAPAAKAAKGKKKTGLIVGIIIAILALAGGIVALVLILNNNKKDPVSAVTDATKNTYRALDGVNIGLKKETANLDNVDGMDLTVDGTISVKGSISDTKIDGDLNFNAKIAQNKDVEVALDVDALIDSRSLKGSIDTIVTNDAVYAKFGNIKNLMSFFSDAFGSDSSYLESEEVASMIAMLNNQWVKVTSLEADQNQTPINFNFSLSGKQDTLAQLQEYVDIEAYSGSEVQKKIGDLYKLTPKEEKASGDPVYVEIKDDKIVRLYTKGNNLAFGEATFDGEISFDITFNYDKVQINIPENALALYGGQTEPTDTDDDDDDYDIDDFINSLDDDELEEFKQICRMLGEDDFATCLKEFADMTEDYDYDDYDFDFDDYDYDDYDFDELYNELLKERQ